MTEKIFCGKTLDECLERASKEMNILKQDIKYEIIENKKIFFKRKVSIKAVIDKEKKHGEENDDAKLKNNDGSVKIVNGNFVVKNPDENGKAAIVKVPEDGITLLIDGVKTYSDTKVYENNKIEVVLEEKAAKRQMNITISPDDMEAYINIEYIPKKTYKLKNSDETSKLTLEKEEISVENPPFYTGEEIKQELITSGIKFGIIEENIYNSIKMNKSDKILVAKGLKPIDGIDDVIDIKFEMHNKTKQYKEDSSGNIDYKSIGYVKEVKKGDVLATRIEGKPGKNGLDIKGKVKKHKKNKQILMKVGEGCELIEENTAVASIDGKPYMKGNIFVVHQVHEVKGDVDISTGDVKFKGDIIIFGNVKEGMKVSAGHNLMVEKNVENGQICAKGDLEIYGNAINSVIFAGGEEIVKINKIDKLEKLLKGLEKLINAVENIRKLNLIEDRIRDGEVIKLLIENKFKYIPNLSAEYLQDVTKNSTEDEINLAKLLNSKLVNFGPLNISSYKELSVLSELISKNMKKNKDTLSVPVNMKVNYCQDSNLKSSGDITIMGKGEYVSNILANEKVVFESSTSVARGGVIKAKSEIRCREVGSEAGVSTKLIVESKGHIWVDRAYQNTNFIIGAKEYILDSPSKDIHAYLDSKGELVVDKFNL